MTSSVEGDTMPWYNPLLFPVAPGADPVAPELIPYRWLLTFDVTQQLTSSYSTRQPGAYNGQDIMVGQWLANTSGGSAWQIISVPAKTSSTITVIVQDVYRYNTFKDPKQLGDGAPPQGYYVAFNVSDSGVPEIDPVPEVGISSNFFTNLLSRFEYINLQFDFPIYQLENNFQVNDVIGTDSITHSFVLSSDNATIPVGRVTSISDTIPGWFTINPVQKMSDFLNSLPGDIGDIIYTDVNNPGKLTTERGGSQIYLKIRNNTSSISYSGTDAVGNPGNVFQLNEINATLPDPGDLDSLVLAAESISLSTGVNAIKTLIPSVLISDPLLFSPLYMEPLLNVMGTPPTATINGVLVTFDIASTDAGYTSYARASQMMQSINNASIPDIVASIDGINVVILENMSGGTITIVNGIADSAGVYFAGTDSGSGLPLSVAASTQYRVKFTAIDSRPIDFLDVVGSPTGDFGLISVENGIKACGMYIAEGIRISVTTVVADLAMLYSLTPLIGDQAYVIDSDDGNGNNVGEWSIWLFNGLIWIQTGNQDSATTDAKSLEYTLTISSASTINIGKISTGRRVTLITVEVKPGFEFNGPATLSIGYTVLNPTDPAPVPTGLMSSGLIDLTMAGTYTTTTDVLFGTDTIGGDVEITSTFGNPGSGTGEAQIIVSYV